MIAETEERVGSLLQAMGFVARVDVYDAGGFVAADVAPDNTALFIGQKGETIDALQYLVNAGVNKNRASRARIVLDAEGYRQRRVEALQGMAHRTARKVIREGRTVELPPMNPSERRVVHLFLRDNPGVITESDGTGDSRRVRVSRLSTTHYVSRETLRLHVAQILWRANSWHSQTFVATVCFT